MDNFVILLFCIAIVVILIFFVAERVTNSADCLVKSTGISEGFIGFVLIAVITSIPEMVGTFFSAAQGYYGLVISGVLGSNIVNIAIFSGICLYFGQKNIQISNVSTFSILTSLFFLSLTFICILIYPVFRISGSNFFIAIIFIITYFYMIYLVYKITDHNQVNSDFSSKHLLHIIFLLCVYGAILVMVSMLLVTLCKQISSITIPIYNKKLGEYFVGSLILAVATSMPELATTFQMIKHDQTDMALGNIAGSNSFNLLILALSGLFVRGSLWNYFPIASLLMVVFAFFVSLFVAMFGIISKRNSRTIFVHWLILGFWLISIVVSIYMEL